MEKIKCTIQYDGTDFFGYQIQPNKRTVQGEVEQVLKNIHKGTPIRIHASGRTDTGVHAKGQVFHFETPLQIPSNNWKKALNAQLPDDLYIAQVEKVPPSFHARFSALEKEYRYYILLTEEPNIFLRNYRYQTTDYFNEELLQEACEAFTGTHDFTAFSSARSTVKGDKIRTLHEVRFERKDDELIFILRGDGFLYHMVRIIVSVLLEAGRGEITREEINEMFHRKNRGNHGSPLPPQGLYLWNVTYPDVKEN